MRYVATITDDIIISKGINHTDYVDGNEIELTEEQYNSMPIPCRLVDGEYVPCDFPDPITCETSGDKEVTELEQLRADVDYIAVMTGVEL